jgi:hypothetical protein
LAQVRLLALEVPLAKLVEEAKSQEYLDVVEQAKPGVDELAEKIIENLNINISSPDEST